MLVRLGTTFRSLRSPFFRQLPLTLRPRPRPSIVRGTDTSQYLISRLSGLLMLPGPCNSACGREISPGKPAVLRVLCLRALICMLFWGGGEGAELSEKGNDPNLCLLSSRVGMEHATAQPFFVTELAHMLHARHPPAPGADFLHSRACLRPPAPQPGDRAVRGMELRVTER